MPDYPDLPPVSEDPNQPLPDVAPDSELVPYRIGRKDPGGEYQYTTGYAPRGRPAIAPPQGMGFSGAGVPDLSGLISEAFQRLPVDEALKMSEFATKYIAQRGYMADINAGKDAAVSFAKWAPVGLFKVPTGIPEAINRAVPTPLSQMQRYQIARNQPLDAALIAERQARAAAAAKDKSMHVLSSGEVLQETGDPNNPIKVVRPRSATTNADKDIDYQIKAQNLMGLKPTELPTDPSYQTRTNLAAEIIKRHPLKTETLPNPAARPQIDAAQPLAKPQELKPLTKEAVEMFKKQSGGDKEKARKLAQDAGYQL